MAESNASLNKIREHFEEAILSSHSHLGQETVVIVKSSLVELCQFLKHDLAFHLLVDITAVDFWKRKPRFEVVYHFLSLKHKNRLRVKVPVGGSEPELDTISHLWGCANWYEREVFDMFGIRFLNHPDLKRILMYPEFEGHPLRKDYPIHRRQPLVGPQD